MLKLFNLITDIREGLINITPQVQEAVKESGISEGICVIYIPHTTAAVTVNSAMDETTLVDITSELKRLVPTRVDFNHTYDTPADAAGHIKATLVGNSAALIVSDDKLVLGSSQSIFFYEFDGPRARRFMVRVVADQT